MKDLLSADELNELETYEIFENWLIENIEPCDWSNYSRYRNYLAITTKDENGEYEREFLKQSKNKDEYFNVAPVKVGDILWANCWDDRKRRGRNWFYVVIEKTNDELQTLAFTTYLKAKKWVVSKTQPQAA